MATHVRQRGSRRGDDCWINFIVKFDLNTQQGGWTVPGTISACTIDAPLPTSSPANPLGSTATSAPSISSSSALVPAVYWFGHAEPRQNTLLMERLVRNLGDNINSRHYNDTMGSLRPLRGESVH